MAGMIDEDAGLINQGTGLIIDNTGMIESSTGMIDEDAGLITETNNTKHTVNGRRKRSKERGRDSKPRNFPLHTMKNLPQFRNKSHEEFRQHILEKKGIDIGHNFAWNNTIIWILIGFAFAACGIGIAKWWKEKEKRKNLQTRSE